MACTAACSAAYTVLLDAAYVAALVDLENRRQRRIIVRMYRNFETRLMSHSSETQRGTEILLSLFFAAATDPCYGWHATLCEQ